MHNQQVKNQDKTGQVLDMVELTKHLTILPDMGSTQGGGGTRKKDLRSVYFFSGCRRPQGFLPN